MNSQSVIITVFTIGHSTRRIDEFITMMKSYAIELIADVRTIPKSCHNPQFNADAFAIVLNDAGIDYLHMKGLGGLRHAKKDSVNTGWKNAGFRGYADYMQTDEFEANLHKLIEAAKQTRTAIMCAEAVPWRCHRSLIADALAIRGSKVIHIMSKSSVREHTLTPWAVVNGMTITYPIQ
jgi:uncharacterized protein (DUF488 family)